MRPISGGCSKRTERHKYLFFIGTCDKLARMDGDEPLLRIPPFPGAKVRSLARRRAHPPAEQVSDRHIDGFVEEIREARVGGNYWEEDATGIVGDLRSTIRSDLTKFEYLDPFTGEPMPARDAIRLCGFWRSLIQANRDIGTAVGFAFWKRPTVAPLLWDGRSPVRFASKLRDVDSTRWVAVWKARTSQTLLAELERSGTQLIEVEDGFIRSAGLGADCVPPLSIVVDRLGVHFDPAKPSELERLLQDGDFPAELLERAARLRELIVATGVGKYGAGPAAAKQGSDPRRLILVLGQVEDDRAVLCGAGEVRTNLGLLRAVREQRPDGFILYKPHPDVEAGHRIGGLAEEECLRFADAIVRDEAIGTLIDQAEEVHVISSLAGFEALLRGKSVTTYGAPFYAGWGLTRDLGPVPGRRTARRTLNELVAAVLLLYPRYLDPKTGLPCPPEVLISRLAESAGEQRQGIVVQLRRLQGRWKRLARAGLG